MFMKSALLFGVAGLTLASPANAQTAPVMRPM